MSSLLFGNDLKGSLAAIDRASKLGMDFTQSRVGRRFVSPITKSVNKRGMDRQGPWEEPRLDQRETDERPRNQQTAGRMATETRTTVTAVEKSQAHP